MTRLRRHACALLLLTAAASPAAAAPVTIEALDSGFYQPNGLHVVGNQNYLTGLFGNEHRSFFLFDLSTVTGTINSATLRLFNPEVSQFLHGYVSPDPTETLNFFDVTTAAASIADGTGGVAAFADLASGTLYGSQIVSAADNGTVIEITLNNLALADLNAATGIFAIGGALGTIDGIAAQYVFGFSMAAFVEDHTRQLVLDVTAVPEPPLPVLLVAVTIALSVRMRSR
jgi:hypothetical protein